ncbi:MAG: class I SAM-dependent methyltransferase [Fusobacteriaceae bacterium]
MFIKEFLKNPMRTGAVCQSGKFLARKIAAEINYEKAKCIVEFGAGGGVFTDLILKKMHSDAKLFIFETNNLFMEKLKARFSHDKRVIFISDSAEHVTKILEEQGFDFADYIVSGLPFSFFPPSLTKKILKATKYSLHPEGKFIAFQYSKALGKLFDSYFRKISYHWVPINLPPAFVLSCMNTNSIKATSRPKKKSN